MWEENAGPINTLRVGLHVHKHTKPRAQAYTKHSHGSGSLPEVLARGVAAGTECVRASSQLAGSKYILADGFHNVEAAVSVRRKYRGRNFRTLQP